MNNKGFTLIELLVVVAIIGLLASIVTVAVQQGRTGARDSRRMADMTQAATAMELYYSANETYGSEGANGTGGCTAITGYMSAAPTDPGTGTYTCYSDADSFCFSADLEDNDPGDHYAVSNQGSGGKAGACASANDSP